MDRYFRPLSGNCISQWDVSPAYDQTLNRFPSPVRELHFSIMLKSENIIINTFPSPVGELHFSISKPTLTINTRGIAGFRPLSGNYISQYYIDKYKEIKMNRFPSPVGELHFSIYGLLYPLIMDGKVSVPCRGTTFLNPL